MNKPADFFAGRTAEISACGKYRYRLGREVGPWPRIACFVMLNPSTADHQVDDRTICRCMDFAQRWSCGELVVVNLFAFRATDPIEMMLADDPIGPKNGDHIVSVAARAHNGGGLVVAAWGALGYHLDQDCKVMELLAAIGVTPKCLGTTAEGYPRHPLYLKKETVLQPYAGRPSKGA